MLECADFTTFRTRGYIADNLHYVKLPFGGHSPTSTPLSHRPREASGRLFTTLVPMGRTMSASDIQAGPKDPAGSLALREQFSFVSPSGRLQQSWKIPFDDRLPIHSKTLFPYQHGIAGPSWAANQHPAGFESWREQDQLFLLDSDSPCQGCPVDLRIRVIASWSSPAPGLPGTRPP